MIAWEKALDDLMAGNERFVSGTFREDRSFEAQRRVLVEEGQRPIAAIVCTSDAYMPPELVFDAELGELYVLRMPALSITREVLDGIAFAAEKLEVPLCMILTHTARAGDPEVEPEEGFWQIFRREEEPRNEEECIKECVQRVRSYGALEERIGRGEFFVVGAKYDLESGTVAVFDFLDE